MSADAPSPPSDPRPGTAGRADRLSAPLPAAAVAVLVTGFALWCFRLPNDFEALWLLDHAGARHARSVFGLTGLATTPLTFRLVMAALLSGACLAYVGLGAAFVAAPPGARILARRPRTAVLAAAALAALVALLCPASLSGDVYAYVGYARLAVVHHFNPYVATQRALIELRDPTAPFLHWMIASPYGPLWTLLSMLPVAVAPNVSLWTAIVVMKLLAAAALVVGALGAARLAERLVPGRGEAAFALVAFNPLFLIEGPGNGHNDLVMMALVIWALVAVAEQRPRRALALLGLAAAMKFVPLLLAPWIVGRELRRRLDLRFLITAGLLVLAPIALSYLPFWRGAGTLAGLRDRLLSHRAGAGPSVWERLLALLVYGLVSARVIRGGPRALVWGWVFVATAAISFYGRPAFPWYFAWPLLPALAMFDRPGRWAAVLLFIAGASASLFYAVPGVTHRSGLDGVELWQPRGEAAPARGARPGRIAEPAGRGSTIQACRSRSSAAASRG